MSVSLVTRAAAHSHPWLAAASNSSSKCNMTKCHKCEKVFFPSFYSAQNVLKLSPLLSPSLFQLISLRGKLLPKRISFSPSLPPFLSLILIFFLSLSFSSFLTHFSLVLSSTHSHLFNSSSLSISLFLFLSLSFSHTPRKSSSDVA